MHTYAIVLPRSEIYSRHTHFTIKSVTEYQPTCSVNHYTYRYKAFIVHNYRVAYCYCCNYGEILNEI